MGSVMTKEVIISASALTGGTIGQAIAQVERAYPNVAEVDRAIVYTVEVELDWILKQSDCAVLFYDSMQVVGPSGINFECFDKKMEDVFQRRMITHQLNKNEKHLFLFNRSIILCVEVKHMKLIDRDLYLRQQY